MQSSIAVVCLGLLLSVEPAVAQKVYSLTVSVHEDVRPQLTEPTVRTILSRASDLLQHKSGIDCNVTFKLNGPIKPFASGTPLDISDEDDLEAVHRQAGDVKVVGKITFCRTQAAAGEDFKGCAWRRNGRRTMNVTQRMLLIRPILWAHEFGHTTGLSHRAAPEALMSPCKLFVDNVKINRRECDCFLLGPGGCPIPKPEPSIACAENQD